LSRYLSISAEEPLTAEKVQQWFHVSLFRRSLAAK
jgi:hypothetical protein